jgi:hypothetical protein
LAKSFKDSSLPFLSVLVRCTTFARFDFGILAVLCKCCGWLRLRSGKSSKLQVRDFQKNERGILANHRLVQPRLNSAVDPSHIPQSISIWHSDLTPVRST